MPTPTLPVSPAFGGFALDYASGQFAGGASGITAKAGGGQSGATQLAGFINRVTVVASGNDSVLLPTSIPGLALVVINASVTNSLNVFPVAGDNINNGGINNPFALTALKVALFVCASAGQWHTILTA